MAASSAGDIAAFAGGSSVVDIYNGSANAWTTSSLSRANWGLSSASITGVKNLTFFAGGGSGSGFRSTYVARVDIFDWATNSGTTATLSQARGYIGAASLGNTVFFAGGFYESFSATKRVDIYDATTNTWTSSDALSRARCLIRATSIPGRNLVLFAGGSLDGMASPSDVVDIYNDATNQWTTARLSLARSFVAATSLGDLAFFAGGVNPGTLQPFDVVDIYNAATNRWTTATLSQARYQI